MPPNASFESHGHFDIPLHPYQTTNQSYSLAVVKYSGRLGTLGKRTVERTDKESINDNVGQSGLRNWQKQLFGGALMKCILSLI